MGGDRPRRTSAVPARRLSGRRRRERSGRAPGQLFPAVGRGPATRSSRPMRCRAACSGAGRSSSDCSHGRSPSAPAEHGTRPYERYDWNSLLADEPRGEVHPTRPHGRHVVVPVPAGEWSSTSGRSRSAPELRSDMGSAGPGREWTAIASCLRQRTANTGRSTSIFAVGVAHPWRPVRRGWSTVAHYVETRKPRAMRASASSLSESRTRASSSRAACCNGREPPRPRVPAPAKSVGQHAFAGGRPRAVLQPWEDSIPRRWRGVLNASIERVERRGDGST